MKSIAWLSEQADGHSKDAVEVERGDIIKSWDELGDISLEKHGVILTGCCSNPNLVKISNMVKNCIQ